MKAKSLALGGRHLRRPSEEQRPSVQTAGIPLVLEQSIRKLAASPVLLRPSRWDFSGGSPASPAYILSWRPDSAERPLNERGRGRRNAGACQLHPWAGVTLVSIVNHQGGASLFSHFPSPTFYFKYFLKELQSVIEPFLPLRRSLLKRGELSIIPRQKRCLGWV